MPETGRDLRRIRRTVQVEAGAWGVFAAFHNAFINPLLVSRGAGAAALGIFSSGASLLGFGSGFVGPRLASRIGGARRTTLLALTAGRVLFIGIALVLVLIDEGAVPLLVAVTLLWAAAEGLALPLWTSFLTGMVAPSERGRWLAMRATAATAASALVLVSLFVVLQFASAGTAMPLAYGLAAGAGLASLAQLRMLFALTPEPPVPPSKSARSFPQSPSTRRFLLGVLCFWFGAGLVGPVLPPYIINELDAPTAFFGAIAVLAAGCAVLVQRRWGRLGDERGARVALLIGGLGTSAIPLGWAVVPVYWLGLAVEAIAAMSWPGHLLGLTLRSSELATNDADRPSLMAWTNLAQGAGACMSPLIASVLVGFTGPIPILVASGLIRLGATFILGEVSLRMLVRQWSTILRRSGARE